MALVPGSLLGAYEVTAPIGAGGMGEVYRARDTKLGREVAIKTLPEEFARDTDRLARFDREAKLLASLNHPNIAAIYGLEEFHGSRFLVLELIEGDTLADRIGHGPIPVDESLQIALQIAVALEAAHEKGVLHRDLKPANIKVTPDGRVKVLDFGLAKTLTGDAAEATLSNSPTLSMTATQQGVILGTAAYMSPEQAKGGSVDKRTDVWAFGCVLYEMLTSRQAFEGEDVSEIMASVIKGGVNLDALPAGIHPKLRGVLARCLSKDAKRRFRDIGDVRFELEEVLADPSGARIPAMASADTVPKPRLTWVVAGVVFGALVTGIAVWNLRPLPAPEPSPVVRFDHTLPDDQSFRSLNRPVVDISPDGRHIQRLARALSALDGWPDRAADSWRRGGFEDSILFTGRRMGRLLVCRRFSTEEGPSKWRGARAAECSHSSLWCELGKGRHDSVLPAGRRHACFGERRNAGARGPDRGG